MPDVSLPPSTEKQRRILHAARFLILRDGLRATTMQAIAREAGIAKPTLYGQFADKDAVFVGLVDMLMAQITVAVQTGLNGQGSVARLVGAALAGQYTVLAEFLDGSPHADDLLNEHRRTGARFRQHDLQLESRIADVLRAAGVTEPELLTRLLLHAAYGIALKTRDIAATTAGIKLLCQRMITPALPGAMA